MNVYWLIALAAVFFVAVLMGRSTACSRRGRTLGVRIDFDGYKGREINERYVNHNDPR